MSDKKIVKEWFRYAHNDLLVAKRCITDFYPKQTEIAAYHSQQCAEKSLKGYLLHKDIAPSKIHDLKLLCKMCQDIDAAFAGITVMCAHLTPLGVAVRYPDEIIPDETMVEAAINQAQRVYDFCITKIDKLEVEE